MAQSSQMIEPARLPGRLTCPLSVDQVGMPPLHRVEMSPRVLRAVDVQRSAALGRLPLRPPLVASSQGAGPHRVGASAPEHRRGRRASCRSQPLWPVGARAAERPGGVIPAHA